MSPYEAKEKIIWALESGLKVCGGCQHLDGIRGREGNCVKPEGYPGPRDIAHMVPNSRGCFLLVSSEVMEARLDKAFPSDMSSFKKERSGGDLVLTP